MTTDAAEEKASHRSDLGGTAMTRLCRDKPRVQALVIHLV